MIPDFRTRLSESGAESSVVELSSKPVVSDRQTNETDSVCWPMIILPLTAEHRDSLVSGCGHVTLATDTKLSMVIGSLAKISLVLNVMIGK